MLSAAQVCLPKGSSDNDQNMRHDNFRKLTLASVLVSISVCLLLSSVLTNKSSRKAPVQSCKRILPNPHALGSVDYLHLRRPHIKRDLWIEPCMSCDLQCLSFHTAYRYSVSLKITKPQSYSEHPRSHPPKLRDNHPGPKCNKYLQITTPTRHVYSTEGR